MEPVAQISTESRSGPGSSMLLRHDADGDPRHRAGYSADRNEVAALHIERIFMGTSEAQAVGRVVNTDRYPLPEPASADWKRIVSHTRHELQNSGCSVLPDFIQASLYGELQEECARIAPQAYYHAETVNVYNTTADPSSPEDHPGRITMRRGNAFVARDRIDKDLIIHRLYNSELFQHFISRCFELPRLHELADPLSGLCLNVLTTGMEHPWHFDTNEFTVSLITQEPQGGGIFEYCPNIRSTQAENFDDVRAVLTGHGEHMIRRISPHPGDLQLFKGRYSMHRVSPVQGRTARHSAIFAYSEKPGVIGSAVRTRQLFGRVLPQHMAAEGHAVRVDRLLD